MFISFLSDFGLADEFVGVVHGVVARLAPEVRVIDVTHGIPQGNVRAGALALVRAIQYLPEGIALAVVDPGVGSGRRAVVVETEWGYLLGPDNGLLAPAVAVLGGAQRVAAIENPKLAIPSAGATFEARDRFAPAAAMLASGEARLEDVGPEFAAAALTPLLLPVPEVSSDEVQGEVWWVDRFGNAQTNVGPEELEALGLGVGDAVQIAIGAVQHRLPWVRAYSEVGEGEAIVVVDSSGLISLSVREDRAAERLGAFERTAVRFRRPEATTSGLAPPRRSAPAERGS
ncbi:MAG TPA: SAM-dependent chlorinase/fluorinase [Acidimicrobiia bacterium]